MDEPAILVVECFRSTPTAEQRAVLAVFRSSESDPPASVECCRWHIETKYYQADVVVNVVDALAVPQTNCTSVEALIIVYDDFAVLKQTDFLHRKLFENAEIKILTCVRVGDDQRQDVVQWCIDHGFDLVETDPAAEYLAEAEQFHEKVGNERIVEILQAHAWNNSEPRDERESVFEGAIAEDRQSTEAMSVLPGGTKPLNLFSDRTDAKNDGQSPQGRDSAADPCSAFEYILQNFEALKQHAESLSWEERRTFAEETVLKLWEEIGTDEDESEENE